LIYSGLFLAEAKLVNSELFFEAGLMLPLENGGLPALLDFDVDEKIEGHDSIEFFAVAVPRW
jgi:hypothetical protein